MRIYTRFMAGTGDEKRRGVVSLADVARRAGTSQSSASRTLNGRVGVKPEIRKRVLAAVEELGYTPNAAARNLVMKRAGLVALVLCYPDVLLGSQLIRDLMPGLVKILDESDYMLAVLIPSDKRNTRLLGPENFDGAIVVGHIGNEPILNHLEKLNVPTVLFGRPVGGCGFSYVDVDNVNGGRLVTEHLIASGSKEIVMVVGSEESAWSQDRMAGFAAQIEEAYESTGVVGHIQEAPLSPQGGYEGTARALKKWPNVDAFFVSSETLRPGVLHALSESGRSIPGDIAVVSFDDSPQLPFSSPSITAVAQPLSEVSRILGKLLLETIANPDMRQSVLLPAELKIRASSASVLSR